jgi:hypothetical protein
LRALRSLTELGPGREDIVTMALALFARNESAIEIVEPTARLLVARRFDAYLFAYRVFTDALCQLEREIRHELVLPLDPPIKLHATVFPAPRSLEWFELVMGFRLRPQEPPASGMVMKNQHITIPIPAYAN